jgi:putative transposase
MSGVWDLTATLGRRRYLPGTRHLGRDTYIAARRVALARHSSGRDIRKLRGQRSATCFHLSVILDIFSRHVVGLLLAERACADLAEQLIAETVSRHDIERGMLTLHADRGASMRSKPAAALLVDLDIVKSQAGLT